MQAGTGSRNYEFSQFSVFVILTRGMSGHIYQSTTPDAILLKIQAQLKQFHPEGLAVVTVLVFIAVITMYGLYWIRNHPHNDLGRFK